MCELDKKVEQVFELFHKYGDHEFCGENLTQTSHAIQTAMQAEKAGEPPEVILGALFHDIGNLVGKDKDDVEHLVVDNVNIGPVHHDVLGEEYLKQHGFPLEIRCFAGHHGEAIRYRAYKTPGYKDSLSWTSQKILERKGGPMSKEEAEAFEKLPHYDAIIKCRDWDENAKKTDIKVTPLETYKEMYKKYLASKKG